MSSPWPDSLFAAPILRSLDDVGRGALAAAGRLRTLTSGEGIYELGELGDAFFVVARGEIELSRPGVGLEPGRTRLVRSGESFGEEAALAGALRISAARARGEAVVAELPLALLRRVLGRAGGAVEDTPALRLLRRRASAELLAAVPLTADLDEGDRGRLLDAVEHRAVARGEPIFTAGDAPDGLWLIVHGLVQLQREDLDGRAQVCAYLEAGDAFGEAELLDGRPRGLSAVAMGGCQLLRAPARVYRSLLDRNPELLARARRLRDERHEHQAQVVEAAPSSTRHVFADLYRMQMARSLLTIDQDACVRCGHCAWSCAQVHGVARLVRRGDKVLTRLRTSADQGASELLLPNSCQHCKNPACMIDCPTGAIGRDVEGEVFIREALCTGCGACAKACPWENIRMAPRALDPRRAPSEQFDLSLRRAAERRGASLEAMFPEVATKCDLCRDYQAPACVQSCPTGAIVRLEPQRDFAEVAALLGLPPSAAGHEGGGAEAEHENEEEGARGKGRRASSRAWRRAGGRALLAGLGVAGVAALVLAVGLRARGALAASHGWGWLAGVIAAATMLALASYALPKRVLRLWMRPRVEDRRAKLSGEAPRRDPLPRSRVRPFYLAHLGLGMLLPAALVAHAGLPARFDLAGLLALLAWSSVALGGFGAVAQALIPRRLTRLERSGALPEDLARERERLLDQLQRALTGRSPALKQAAAEVAIPWVRAPAGWVRALVLGGELRALEAQLRARIEAALPEALRLAGEHPRARAEALAGLDALVRTCVELRVLPARRVWSAALRGWHGPHAMITGALLVALVAHIVTVVWP
ncbi:cyclic nucleotide-binding domain-containing protein [Pseudenhygromyxa sp. WMMC2535]|uniref:cyclic nucleotide-binding domain-containing protein n=1 Tax=Pseudenhygromyxa sp. WMMC2535 TaxID=2712867 RepID=UPI0015545921|nr:cyclic nucleotide-binding domain-containing protein [Pseudenhygromyxa sp. WMMC2535]NVB39544.1 cyclic nucleotide-binding domain-containing protein [Pseudenhygromyxa sp. WMMC2535]